MNGGGGAVEFSQRERTFHIIDHFVLTCETACLSSGISHFRMCLPTFSYTF